MKSKNKLFIIGFGILFILILSNTKANLLKKERFFSKEEIKNPKSDKNQNFNHEDNFWKVSSGEESGINKKFVKELEQLCKITEADSCLIIYKGKIISEYYSKNYHYPVYAMSSTKSVAGLLTGMLIDEGKIKSVKDKVYQYIPEWNSGNKKLVTIEHLLTHTAGFKRAWGKKDSVGYAMDKNTHVINFSLKYNPGTRFEYSNEAVQLLSPVLDKAAGEPIQDYARKKLFEPLGMSDTRLNVDSKGHAWTYADMITTPRDFARIGILLLNKGKWNNKQIISEKWLKESLKPSLFNKGYGYLWWLYPELKGFAALGYLDNNMYIFPEKELIIVRTQSPPEKNLDVNYNNEAKKIFRKMLDINLSKSEIAIEELQVLSNKNKWKDLLNSTEKYLKNRQDLPQKDICTISLFNILALINNKQTSQSKNRMIDFEKQCNPVQGDDLIVLNMVKDMLSPASMVVTRIYSKIKEKNWNQVIKLTNEIFLMNDVSLENKCVAFTCRAYALSNSAHKIEARKFVNLYDDECTYLRSDYWTHKTIKSIKEGFN
jgi:hypothetical protein